MPARESFDDFMKRRSRASVGFLNGDLGDMLDMAALEDPSTFFPVNGGAVSGAERVNDVHRQSGRKFSSGTAWVEMLQFGSDVEMGFWAGIVHADVVLRGETESRSVKLRMTEVFRRNEQGWKLVHRHADRMVDQG